MNDTIERIKRKKKKKKNWLLLITRGSKIRQTTASSPLGK